VVSQWSQQHTSLQIPTSQQGTNNSVVSNIGGQQGDMNMPTYYNTEDNSVVEGSSLTEGRLISGNSSAYIHDPTPYI
jgi:hypothetical protein